MVNGKVLKNTSDDISMSKAPRLSGWSRIANLVRVRIDSLSASEQVFKRYGDFVQITDNLYLTRSPEYTRQILTNYDIFEKDFHQTYGRSSELFWGSSLLTSNTEGWLHKRSVLQAALQLSRLETYAESLVKLLSETTQTWKRGQRFDLHRELMRLTLATTVKNVLGCELTQVEFEIIENALYVTLHWFDNLYLQSLNFESDEEKQFKNSLNQMNALILDLIRQHRSHPDDRGAILSILLTTPKVDGTFMTDQELRDEVVTMLRAGHRNTSTLLAWSLALLIKHPQVAIKLKAEAEQVCGNRLPNAEDHTSLSYSAKVIKETMRLYPLYPFLPRSVKRNSSLGRYRLSANNLVVISVWAMHRNTRYFENPTVFNPERWSTDFENSLPDYAFIPFGGGGRRCPFKTLGMIEAVLGLTALAHKSQFRFAPGCQLIPKNTTSGLFPKDGLQIIID